MHKDASLAAFRPDICMSIYCTVIFIRLKQNHMPSSDAHLVTVPISTFPYLIYYAHSSLYTFYRSGLFYHLNVMYSSFWLIKRVQEALLFKPCSNANGESFDFTEFQATRYTTYSIDLEQNPLIHEIDDGEKSIYIHLSPI